MVEILEELRPSSGSESAPAVPAVAHDAIVTLEEGERIHIRQALAARTGRIHGPEGAAPAGHQPKHPPVTDEEARHHEAARFISLIVDIVERNRTQGPEVEAGGVNGSLGHEVTWVRAGGRQCRS